MFENFKEQFDQKTKKYQVFLKNKILGPNNENLDFVLDSFYKLEPEKQKKVVFSGIGVLGFFVLGLVALFILRINALDRELNDTFLALHELRQYSSANEVENKKFLKLIEMVSNKTANLKMKPYFEKLSKEKKLDLKNINERDVDANPNDPLYSKISQVNVEMKIPSVSIPRMLDFLISVEKSGNYLRIQDLKISGIYGNKLFFDVNLIVRGYSVKPGA